MIEKKLARLLDYQRFRQNARLLEILGDVEKRYANALNDEDLELVSAAGDLDVGVEADDHDG